MPYKGNFGTPQEILIMGDSITEFGDREKGYVTLLKTRFGVNANFHNYGISAVNSKLVEDFTRSPKFRSLLPGKIHRAYINIGANDDVISQTVQHVDLEQFGINLEKTYNTLKPYVGQVIFNVVPPLDKYADRSRENTEKYAAKTREIALKVGTHFVDMRTKMKEGDNIWCDGLHMNDLGNQYLYQVIQDDMQKDVDNWRNGIYNWTFCDEGWVLNDETGKCQCISGTFQSGDKCVSCPEHSTSSPDGLTCQCNTKHQNFDVQKNMCVCNVEGAKFNNFQNKCLCDYNQFVNKQNKCEVCPNKTLQDFKNPNACDCSLNGISEAVFNIDEKTCSCKDTKNDYSKNQFCVTTQLQAVQSTNLIPLFAVLITMLVLLVIALVTVVAVKCKKNQKTTKESENEHTVLLSNNE